MISSLEAQRIAIGLLRDESDNDLIDEVLYPLDQDDTLEVVEALIGFGRGTLSALVEEGRWDNLNEYFDALLGNIEAGATTG